MSWIIFLIFVLFFAFRGYRSGALNAVSRIVSLVVAYGASLWLTEDAAQWLRDTTVIGGIASYVVGGLGVFALVSVVISLLFVAIGKWIGEERLQSSWSRWLGLGVGSAAGIVLGLMVVFLVGYLRDLLPLAQKTEVAPVVRSQSAIEKASRQAAGGVVTMVSEAADMDPTAAKLTAALTTQPAQVLHTIQRVAQNPAGRQLFQDPANQKILVAGDPAAIARLPAFQALAADPATRELARLSGFEGAEAESFERHMAKQTGKLWGRAQQVQNNPEIRAILDDPEFQAEVQGRQLTQLMTDERFLTLITALLSDPAAGESPGSQGSLADAGSDSPSSTTKPGKDSPTIYSWVDEEGKRHYSDKPPEQQ